VFAGRFKAVLIQDTKGVAEVARYVHLNPVRVEGLGLGKADQRQARVVGCADPGAELVNQRLERLRAYRKRRGRGVGGSSGRKWCGPPKGYVAGAGRNCCKRMGIGDGTGRCIMRCGTGASGWRKWWRK
jgi:hypothetical protein